MATLGIMPDKQYVHCHVTQLPCSLQGCVVLMPGTCIPKNAALALEVVLHGLRLVDYASSCSIVILCKIGSEVQGVRFFESTVDSA